MTFNRESMLVSESVLKILCDLRKKQQREHKMLLSFPGEESLNLPTWTLKTLPMIWSAYQIVPLTAINTKYAMFPPYYCSNVTW